MIALNKNFVMMFLLVASPLLADNAIYIDQIGSEVDINITQDGSNNKIGGSESEETKMLVDGDNIDMTFNTVGSNNSIIGNIIGDDTIIDFDINGNANNFNFNVDPTDTFGATNNNFTLDLTGSDNTLELSVGTEQTASNGIFNWIVEGDYNNATINIDVDSFTNTVDWIGDNNNIIYDANGFSGHEFTVSGSGNYTNLTVEQQSTLQSDSLEIIIDGGGTFETPSNICISQSDSGVATGCQ